MAATEKKNIWLYSTPDGVAPEIKEYPMAASMGVFMPGTPCYLSEAGTIKLSDTSDGTGDTHHGFIVGVRNKDTTWPLTAALSSGDIVRVSWLDPRDLYCVFVESGGSDSAIATSDIGDQFGLVVSATATQIGYTTMNLAETSHVAVQVENVMHQVEPYKHAAADSPGIAIVRFLSSVIDVTRA